MIPAFFRRRKYAQDLLTYRKIFSLIFLSFSYLGVRFFMKITLAIILFFVVNTLYAQNGELSKQQIRFVMDKQIAGWNSGNVDSFMLGYAQFDSLRFASGGSVTYGWKNMLERYKKSYPTKEKMGHLMFSEISIDLISSDAAVVFGKWKLKRANDEPWGLFTLLFKHNNGEWRIIHDHTSTGN